MARLLLAFLLSPLFGIVGGMTAFFLLEGKAPDFVLIAISTFFASLVTYPVVLTVGALALSIMLKRRWLSLGACTAVAVVCALCVWVLFNWPPTVKVSAFAGAALAFPLLCGAIGALAFWSVGVWRNSALTPLSSGRPSAAAHVER